MPEASLQSLRSLSSAQAPCLSPGSQHVAEMLFQESLGTELGGMFDLGPLGVVKLFM